MKKIKLDKKTKKTILIVAIVAVLAIGIFLLVKYLPQGTNGTGPESNVSLTPVKDPQLNAILGAYDNSEPDDTAVGMYSTVVDSTGLS